MTYPDSVRFLYSLGNELKTAKFGLERIARLSAALGSPHRKPSRFVHVAGTNGKGSVCAMIESGLRAAGYRTGLFTSPHLLEPTERIRIDGEPINEAAFRDVFAVVHEAAERLLANGEIDAHPSYFETVTAMALHVFQRRRVEIAVMEVGLGGRLDATNIVESELCVITPVDFDHEKFLGSSIQSIAGEKAGILKQGTPAVIAAQRPEARQVLVDRAAELEVRVIDPWEVTHSTVTAEGSSIAARGITIQCNLAGRHQIGNASVAAASLEALNVPSEAIARGIADARWPGRLQIVSRNPTVLVDGAHNPAGARALAQYVAEFYAGQRSVLIFGVMRDKAVEEMAGILFPVFREVIATAPDQSRALDPAVFGQFADHASLTTAPHLREALARVPDPTEVVFISGSLFLVGEALSIFTAGGAESLWK